MCEQVTYRAVYLREQNGSHVLAIEVGDGRVSYPEIPVAKTMTPIGLEAREKAHRAQPNNFSFGDRIDLTLTKVDE